MLAQTTIMPFLKLLITLCQRFAWPLRPGYQDLCPIPVIQQSPGFYHPATTPQAQERDVPPQPSLACLVETGFLLLVAGSVGSSPSSLSGKKASLSPPKMEEFFKLLGL